MLLPGAEDADVDDYERRIEQTTGRRFFLVVNHIQTIDWTTFERVRERATHLHNAHGERAVRAALLIGNDRFSGFGVHFDEGCLQQVQDVIVGRKRAFLWERDVFTPEVWTKLSNTTHFNDYADTAVVLEAAAGEAISWPGSCYHVMENLDGCSVGVTITYRERAPGDLRHELRRVLTEAAAELAQRHGANLPDVERVQRDLRVDALQTLAEPFLAQMAALHLCAETTSCVEYSPCPRSVTPCKVDDLLERKSESPIRWVRRGRQILFSSCGHFYEIDDAPDWAPAFLAALHHAGSATVCELAAKSGVPDHQFPIVLEIVDALRASNALV